MTGYQIRIKLSDSFFNFAIVPKEPIGRKMKYAIMRLLSRIRHCDNYCILRPNLVCIAGILLVGGYLYRYSSENSNIEKISFYIGALILLIGLSVLLAGALTSFVAWGQFIIKKRILEKDPAQRADIIKIFFDRLDNLQNHVPTKIDVYGIRTPLLGFARVRLVFSDYSQSNDIYLSEAIRETTQNGIKEVGVRGKQVLKLPHCRDYRIDHSFICFEDMFHLFSLPYREKEKMGIYTLPIPEKKQTIPYEPRLSMQAVKRISRRRVVTDELLNYKKFEPGDDIRRIVWKVYAKNHEIMIRIPDTIHPFAYYIDVFASFINDYAIPAPFQQVFLDRYKCRIRELIESIQSQGLEVRLFLDQEPTRFYSEQVHNSILYRLSAAQWQPRASAESFLSVNRNGKNQNFSIICLSSLTPVSVIEQIMARDRSILKVLWVDTTQVCSGNQAFRPIDLVLLNETSGSVINRNKITAAIRHNEKAISALLSGSMKRL
jgi:hypothetical protein